MVREDVSPRLLPDTQPIVGDLPCGGKQTKAEEVSRVEPSWVRCSECHKTGRFCAERDGYCACPTFARPALMLAPEQGGKAPSGHRGGMGGRELCKGTAGGPTRPQVFWGGGGPGSVAGCESRAAVRFWHHLLDKSFPRNKTRNAAAERVGQALPPSPTSCTLRCVLCPLLDR